MARETAASASSAPPATASAQDGEERPGRPDVSLVICTLNESESIGAVLTETQGVFEGLSYEIIVVDDSPDERTADVVRARAAGEPRIRLVRREGARGLASACIAGWDAAHGKILGVMDGDGQHDTQLARTMVEMLQAGGADIAVASRFAPGAHTGLSGIRKAMSTAATPVIQLLIGARCTDPLAGFFFQTRRWYDGVREGLTGIGFKILVDVLASGPRRPTVVEVPTSLRERIGGESKLDLRIAVELVAQLIEKKSRGLIPSRFVMFAGVGGLGMFVHLVVLTAAKELTALPFLAAQGAAIAVAMVSNYTLNNLITFRDLRLKGAAWWRGLLGFALACASGAVLSEMVGFGLNRLHVHWLIAGGTGALAAAMWNYWSASRAAWGVPPRGRDAAAGVAVKTAPTADTLTETAP
jgi:dolichol-phosphate mannosyltransferase